MERKEIKAVGFHWFCNIFGAGGTKGLFYTRVATIFHSSGENKESKRSFLSASVFALLPASVHRSFIKYCDTLTGVPGVCYCAITHSCQSVQVRIHVFLYLSVFSFHLFDDLTRDSTLTCLSGNNFSALVWRHILVLLVSRNIVRDIFKPDSRSCCSSP